MLYHFDAAALDIANKPTAVQPPILVTTAQPVAFTPQFKAVAKSPSTVSVSVDLDPAGNLPAGFKAYLSVQYKQIVDAASGLYGQPQTIGDGSLSSAGVPAGTPYSGSHEFTITGLSPKTSYSVAIIAIDQYGHKYQSQPATVTMLDTVAPLDFDGPIQVTMNTNTGLAVNWTANHDIKTATMDIQFTDNAKVEITPKATTGSKNVSVSTDVAGLGAVLQKTQEKKMTPVIKITMSDGSDTKSQSFSVAFVVAGKSTATTSDPKTKTAVDNVAQAAQDPTKKKISWTDLINTGLGILLKAI